MSLSPVWARNWLVWPERAEDDDNRQNAKIQSCSDYEDDEKKPLEDQPETGKDFDTSNKDSSDNELAKEEKNEADVIIIPATGECDNNWQVYIDGTYLYRSLLFSIVIPGTLLKSWQISCFCPNVALMKCAPV